MWHPRVGSDVFGQYQYNQFLRLQARGVGGVRRCGAGAVDWFYWTACSDSTGGRLALAHPSAVPPETTGLDVKVAILRTFAGGSGPRARWSSTASAAS